MRLAQVTPPVFYLLGTVSNGLATVTNVSSPQAPPFPWVNWTAYVGCAVSGTGIAAGTTVLSIQSPTAFTLSQNVTSNGPITLTMGVEPVTLTEAMQHCRFEVPSTDPVYAAEVQLLQTIISAARRAAETQMRCSLITQTWILYLDSFPSAGGYYNRAIREIWPSLGGLPSGLGFYPGLVPNSTGVIDIPLPPLQTINSVQYIDFAANTDMVPTSSYNVSYGTPSRIQPQYSKVWPISRPTIDSVFVNFTCGYGPAEVNVPESTRLAILALVSAWYENREAFQPGQFMTIPDYVTRLFHVDETGIYA